MRLLPLVLAASNFGALACATGTGGAPLLGPQDDGSFAPDAVGLGVPVLHHEGGAADVSAPREAGHDAVAKDAAAPVPSDASGAGDAHETAMVDASVSHDASSHTDGPAATDAHHADGPAATDAHLADAPGAAHDAHAGMDAGSAWGTLEVVQSSAESSSCALGLMSPTRVGTLLVAMEPGSATSPNGSWTLLASSSDGAQIFIWPDNPGGLQSFTFGSSLFGCDIIFVEFAGVPADVVLDFQKSASAVSNVPSITVTGSTPKSAGELELVYLTAGATPSASVSGWQYLGTDGNTNFGWWQTASTSAPSATAVLSTPTSATIVLANMAD